MRPLARLAFLFLALALACPAPGQDDPLDVGSGTYLVTVGDALVGQETFERTERGWTSRGRYAHFGKPAVEFEARRELTEDGLLEWEHTVTEDGRRMTSYAMIVQESLTFRHRPAGDESTSTIRDDARPFFHGHMVFSSMIDVGTFLAGRIETSGLGAAPVMVSILPRHSTVAPLTLVSARRVRRSVAGREVDLLLLEVDVANRSSLRLLTTPAGLPIRIESGSQRIDVVLAGFETVRWPGDEPDGPLDGGPWRALLSPAAHEIVAEEGLLRPGVDVVRPRSPGRHPVVLVAAGSPGAWAAVLARRGYAVVVADRLEPALLDAVADRSWAGPRAAALGPAPAVWGLASTGDRRLAAVVSLSAEAVGSAFDAGACDVAALHLGGSFEPGGIGGAAGRYAALRTGARTIGARLAQHLIVGPWGADLATSRLRDGVDLGPAAVVEIEAAVVRFLDHYLVGRDLGLEAEEPVLLFVGGDHRWRRAADWPLPSTCYGRLHLGPSGRATSAMPADGAVLEAAPFESSPLVAPVELLGVLEAQLVLVDDGPAGPVEVALERWTADGRRLSLTSGRGRLLAGSGQATVALAPIVERLEAGDRLVVVVETAGRRLGSGSHVWLPIAPSGDAPGLQLARAGR